MQGIGSAARAAAPEAAGCLPRASRKIARLLAAAAALRDSRAAILAANDADMREAASRGLSAAMLDRLRLDAARVEAMARGLEDIARLADPIGARLAEWSRPNGHADCSESACPWASSASFTRAGPMSPRMPARCA